jgi:hypothetical protein
MAIPNAGTPSAGSVGDNAMTVPSTVTVPSLVVVALPLVGTVAAPGSVPGDVAAVVWMPMPPAPLTLTVP